MKKQTKTFKVVRGVVFRSLTPHIFVPSSAVHLPMSMGGLGVEVMEDNRELVTSWARDLESEHTATRETTRHLTWLVEALRDDLAQNNGGGPFHSDVIRGYGRAGYWYVIGRALVLIALRFRDSDRDPVQMYLAEVQQTLPMRSRTGPTGFFLREMM